MNRTKLPGKAWVPIELLIPLGLVFVLAFWLGQGAQYGDQTAGEVMAMSGLIFSVGVFERALLGHRN